MNEDNQDKFEQNEAEWQAPPLPEDIIETKEPAQMSEIGTLGSIFIEPGATFEDLRRKPRFLIAGFLCILLISLFQYAFIQKVGFERYALEPFAANSRIQQMPEDQKQAFFKQQTSDLAKYATYVITPLVPVIVFLLGGLLYWLGTNAMGGSARFLQSLSVFIYSSFPPIVVSTFANFLVLLLKSADDISISADRSGVLKANLAFLIEDKVLAALLATFDLFAIWGWILAAIGLRIIGKISSGAAWAIVIIVALIGVALRVVGALFS